MQNKLDEERNLKSGFLIPFNPFAKKGILNIPPSYKELENKKQEGQPTYQPRRLLVTPQPFPDENLMGYLVRLTEANGYESLNILYQTIVARRFAHSSLHLYNICRESAHLRALCVLTGVPADVLKQIEERNRLITEGVTTQDLNYCPECLKEKPYYRIVWGNWYYCVCHKHRTILIDTCPSCEKSFKWGSKNITHCQCGHDIRNSSSLAACPEMVSVSHRISGLCDGNVGERKGIFGNEIETLSLSEFCWLLRLMIQLQTGILWANRVEIRENSFHRHKLISQAFKLLQNWPLSFNNFINTQFESASEKLLYIWSQYGDLKNSSLKFVSETWGTHIKNRWPDKKYHENQTPIYATYNLNAKLGKQFNDGKPLEKNILVSEDWIRKNLWENNYSIPYFHSFNNCYEINISDLKEYLSKFALPYSARKIERLYQIPQMLILKLASSGLFEIACHIKMKSGLQPRFNIISVEALFSAIRKHIQHGENKDGVEGITLLEVTELLGRFSLCPVRFIADLQNGVIKPINETQSLDGKGCRFYFSPSDLSAYAKHQGYEGAFEVDVKAHLKEFQKRTNTEVTQRTAQNNGRQPTQKWFQKVALFLDERQPLYRLPHTHDFLIFTSAAQRLLGASRSRTFIPKNLGYRKSKDDEYLQAEFENLFLDLMNEDFMTDEGDVDIQQDV